MSLIQGCLAVWQAEALKHGLRQAFGNRATNALQQVKEHFALPARGQVRSAEGLVDGRDAAHFEQASLFVVSDAGQQFELRLDHLHVARTARGLDFAEQGDGLSGAEAAFEVAAVEPDALHGKIALAYGHFKDGRAFGREQRSAADFSNDGGHFTGLQFVETAWILAVFVTEGKMVQQVFGEQNALGRKNRGHARADSADVCHWGFENGHTLDATTGGQARTNFGGHVA